MAKPGKRVSAFSIELRGVNFWSARMASDVCSSVRAEFVSCELIKILVSHKIGLLSSGRPCEQQRTAACSSEHLEDILQVKVTFNSEMWLQTTVTGKRCNKTDMKHSIIGGVN